MVGGLQSGQHAKQGRLAGPRRPQHCQELAVPRFEETPTRAGMRPKCLSMRSIARDMGSLGGAHHRMYAAMRDRGPRLDAGARLG